MLAERRKSKKTMIGGQSVLEGIVMKGPSKSVMALRLPDGGITTKWMPESNLRAKYAFCALPLVRGVVAMGESLVSGYRALMQSADELGAEEEPTKVDRWVARLTKGKCTDIVGPVSMILGILLAVVIFAYLPALTAKYAFAFIPVQFKGLIEGLLRIFIFIGYIALVGLMPDIRRTYEYHGAEHKSIACYEAGDELSVAQVKKYRRFHPRCGTSFLFLMLLISILVFSFITWDSIAVRLLLKLACLPVVIGVGFELIRYAGGHDNLFTKIVSAPGLWLQRLVTREPDDGQIEVALTALKAVLPEDQEDDTW